MGSGPPERGSCRRHGASRSPAPLLLFDINEHSLRESLAARRPRTWTQGRGGTATLRGLERSDVATARWHLLGGTIETSCRRALLSPADCRVLSRATASCRRRPSHGTSSLHSDYNDAAGVTGAHRKCEGGERGLAATSTKSARAPWPSTIRARRGSRSAADLAPMRVRIRGAGIERNFSKGGETDGDHCSTRAHRSRRCCRDGLEIVTG